MSDDKEKTLDFIEDYRKLQLLWDPKHNDYTNKRKRNDALTALGQKHKLNDLTMVKNKIKSLRSYFSKERQKVLSKQCDEPDFEPSWFAYKSLLFILDTITPTEIKETKENTFEVNSEAASQDENTLEFQAEYVYDFVHPTHTKRNMSVEGPSQSSESTDEHKNNNDEYDIFGQFVAHKLRKLSPLNRLMAEQRISNVLFNIELEEIDTVSSSVSNIVSVGTSPMASDPDHTSKVNSTLAIISNSQNIQRYHKNIISELKNETD